MLARPVNEEQHNCGVSCGAEMLKTFRPNLIIESTDDPKWRRELAFDFEAAWLVLSSSSLRHHHLNCMELIRLPDVFVNWPYLEYAFAATTVFFTVVATLADLKELTQTPSRLSIWGIFVPLKWSFLAPLHGVPVHTRLVISIWLWCNSQCSRQQEQRIGNACKKPKVLVHRYPSWWASKGNQAW